MHKTLFVMFLFCMQLSAQDPVQKSIQAVDKAIDFAQLGRFDLAKRSLQEALKQELDDSERAIILYNLASILLQEGNGKSAEKLFIQIDRDYTVPESIKTAFQLNYAMASLLSIQESLNTSLTALSVQDDLSRFQNRLKQIEKESAILNFEPLSTLLLKVQADMKKAQLLKSIQHLNAHALIVSINSLLEGAKKRLSSYQSDARDLGYYVEGIGIEVLEKQQILSKKLFSLLKEKEFMFPVIAKEKETLENSIQKKSISKFMNSIEILQLLFLSLEAQDPILALLQSRIENKNVSLTDSIQLALEEKIQRMKTDQSLASAYTTELLKDFIKRISNDPVRDKTYYNNLVFAQIPNTALLLMKEDQALSIFQSVWKKKKDRFSKDIQTQVHSELSLLESAYKAWKKNENSINRFNIELSCICISYLVQDLDLQEKAALAASFEEKAAGLQQVSKKDQRQLLVRSRYFLESCKNLLDSTKHSQLLQEIDKQQQIVESLMQQSSVDAQIQFHTELKTLFLRIEDQAKKEAMQEASQDQSQKISLENSLRILQEMEKDDRALVQEIPGTIQEGERPW